MTAYAAVVVLRETVGVVVATLARGVMAMCIQAACKSEYLPGLKGGKSCGVTLGGNRRRDEAVDARDEGDTRGIQGVGRNFELM